MFGSYQTRSSIEDEDIGMDGVCDNFRLTGECHELLGIRAIGGRQSPVGKCAIGLSRFGVERQAIG